MCYGNIKYNKDKVEGRQNNEKEKGRHDGQMRNEECAKEEDQRDPCGEEEGEGGRDVDVMRQGDDTERGD